jgi:hypothetical protein
MLLSVFQTTRRLIEERFFKKLNAKNFEGHRRCLVEGTTRNLSCGRESIHKEAQNNRRPGRVSNKEPLNASPELYSYTNVRDQVCYVYTSPLCAE